MATGKSRSWGCTAGSSGLSQSVLLSHLVGAFFGPLALGSLDPDACPWNSPARQVILPYLPPCHQRIVSVQGSQPSVSSLGLKSSTGHYSLWPILLSEVTPLNCPQPPRSPASTPRECSLCICFHAKGLNLRDCSC